MSELYKSYGRYRAKKKSVFVNYLLFLKRDSRINILVSLSFTQGVTLVDMSMEIPCVM